MFAALALSLALVLQTVPAPREAIPLGSAYDSSNPFAMILNGEASTAVVAETYGALAFMDRSPASPGHVLVIPKSPTVSLLDATPEQLSAVMALSRCVAIAQTAAFTPDGMTGISLRQNNGAPNQHVGHLHMHVLPLYGTRPPNAQTTPMSPEDLEPVAARIRAHLPTTGC